MLGYAPGQVQNMNLRALLTPAALDRADAYFAEIRARGRASGIMEIRTAGGEIRLWQYNNTLRTEGVAAPIVRGTAHDVTYQKQAEKALRQSEERFRALFEVIPSAVFVHRGGRYLDVNPAMIRTTGYTREELLGMPFWELMSPDLQELVKARGQARCEGEAPPSPYEVKILTKSGEERWVMIAASGVSFVGEPTVLGTLIDVSELKAAQAAAERQRQLLTTLTDAMPDYIYVKDADGRLLLSNQAHLGQLGITTQEGAVGKTDADFFPSELAAQYHADDQAVIASGQPLVNREERTQDWEGNGQWLLTTKIPFRDNQGRVVGLVSVGRDVTKHHLLEEQFRQAQKLEAIGQLAGGVAHDFNNILQALMGYSSMLLARLPKEDETYEFAEEIARGTDRAAALTRQLLAFSRRQVLEVEDLDLNEVVEHLVKMIHRVIGEDIQLHVVPGYRLGTVHADRGQMEQILMNLCVNARDAMPDGGKLTIETQNVTFDKDYCAVHAWAVPGQYVSLSITDTGIGMDAETQARIFEPFFTTKTVGHGTGLGLATVYGLVQQHQGAIQVYSEVGKGTTFKIYLPIVEREAVMMDVEIEQKDTGGTETILLAEDEEVVQRLAHQILENAGYTVLTASNGREAIRVFHECGRKIDMILSDVVMPELGGKGIYEELQPGHPDLRFLFSSGYSANAVHTGFVLHEGIELIQKPYSPSALLRKVRDVLDGTGHRFESAQDPGKDPR